MPTYQESLNQFRQMSPRLRQQLSDNVEKVILPAGCVFETKDYDDHIYYLEKGITAVFGVKDNKASIKWFKKEGEFISNARTDSSVHLPHGLEFVTMEESVWRIFKPSMTKELLKNNLEFIWYFTMILVDEVYKIEDHTQIIKQQSLDAYYSYIKQHCPDFFERVPIKYLASYMRVTETKAVEFLKRKGHTRINMQRLKRVSAEYILGKRKGGNNNHSQRA